jgi:hypothetical protein
MNGDKYSPGRGFSSGGIRGIIAICNTGRKGRPCNDGPKGKDGMELALATTRLCRNNRKNQS